MAMPRGSALESKSGMLGIPVEFENRTQDWGGGIVEVRARGELGGMSGGREGPSENYSLSMSFEETCQLRF